MDAIVSVTSDWGIGYKGRLIVSNRQDMARFRELTLNGTVICGRTTFDTLPDGGLPHRRNIVISGSPMPCVAPPGVIVAHGIDEALELAVQTDYGNGRIWVIGGASIYRQMLPMCDNAYVTRHDVALMADTFFPNLDDDPAWELAETQGGGTTGEGIQFEFLRYERRSQ